MATPKSKTDYKWEKDNCTRINLKIRNDSGLVEVIDEARKTNEESRNAYALCLNASRANCLPMVKPISPAPGERSRCISME